jgi:uncharacterized membrane protein
VSARDCLLVGQASGNQVTGHSVQVRRAWQQDAVTRSRDYWRVFNETQGQARRHDVD